MNHQRAAAISLVILHAAAAAFGGEVDAARLRACGAEKSAIARLDCYDRELAALDAAPAQAAAPAANSAALPTPAAAPPAAPAPIAPSPPATTRDATAEFGLEGQALLKHRGEEGNAPKSIAARISRIIPRPGGLQSYELDNGQLWLGTESWRGAPLKPGDEVSIRAGVLGSFFLSASNKVSVRVKRVR